MEQADIYLSVNILIYAVMALWAYRYTRRFAGSVVVFLFYTFTGVASILFYNHPLTAGTNFDRPIFFEPLLFFAALTWVMTYPLTVFDRNMSDKVYVVPDRYIIFFLAGCLCVQLLLYSSFLSYFLSIWNASDLDAMRDDTLTGDAGPSHEVSPMIGRIFFLYNNFRNVACVVAIYAFFFVKTRRRLVVIAAVSTLFYPIFYSMLYVMRSQIFLQIVTIIFFFVILKNYISRRVRIYLLMVGGAFVVIAAAALIIVSEGRFGSLASWMYYRYMGETYINFSSMLWPDIYGTGDGMAYFRWLLTREDWPTMQDKWNYIYSATGVDGHVFNGAIGQLMIEFGAVATTIIYIVISWICTRFLNSNPAISLPNLILIGLLSQLLFYGIYTFPFQGTAMIQVFVYLIFIVFFSKIQYLTDITGPGSSPQSKIE